jgi:Zn-dependent alcohol dehydrogenase
MKIKAAVLSEVNKPYSIEELELEPPKQKEVLVRYVYTGYCHSDLSNLLGNVQMALPIVAGHEGAGIVEAVGPGCTKNGPILFHHRCLPWSDPDSGFCCVAACSTIPFKNRIAPVC